MSSENPVCPLAQAHRRLEDAHRLWHQTADLYSDPDGFRVNLNATIQTLRNVTFALQKQKAVIPSFEAWYQPWQRRMREDPLLRWLVDARNRIVKEEDLVTQSVARIRIVDRYTEVAFVDREVPPLTTLEAAAGPARGVHPAGLAGAWAAAVCLLRQHRPDLHGR